MRLIDVDELPKQEIEDERGYINPSYARGWNDAIRSVYLYAPKIEAEPVRRGRWVEESGMFMCSVCHDVWGTEDEEMIKGFNYCPWCGAKMEEQE